MALFGTRWHYAALFGNSRLILSILTKLKSGAASPFTMSENKIHLIPESHLHETHKSTLEKTSLDWRRLGGLRGGVGGPALHITSPRGAFTIGNNACITFEVMTQCHPRHLVHPLHLEKNSLKSLCPIPTP